MASFEITQKIKAVRLGESQQVVPQQVIVTDVKLPDDAEARLKTFRTEGKKWYVTVVFLPNSREPFALFCHTNSKEKSAQTNDAVERLTALARKAGILEEHIQAIQDKIADESNVTKLKRTISLLLRHRVSIVSIVQTLDTMEV